MAGRRERAGDAALFGFVALVWGLNYLFVHEGLAIAGPIWLAAARAGLGAVVVLAWTALARRSVSMTRADVRDALLIGIPNTATFFGLWLVAATSVPPGQTAVLVYTFPMWVTLLAAPLLQEKPSVGQLVAVAGGFLGVVLVSQPWGPGSHALGLLPTLELLAAAVSWALGTVLFKARFTGPKVRPANAYQLLGGTLGLLVAGVALGGPLPTGLSPTLLLVVLWLGVLGTAVTYSIWFRLLDRYPAGTLSGYTFLVPVVALAASFVVLGERLTLVQFVGVAAIAGAIYLDSRGPNERRV